jgi:hypothetical protein
MWADSSHASDRDDDRSGDRDDARAAAMCASTQPPPARLTCRPSRRTFPALPDLLRGGSSSEVSAMVTAEAVREIVAAITPFIGENMARSATRVHCEKLGIAEPEVTPQQVVMLISRLETGLRVFMGRDKANSLMAPLRVKLGGGS